MTVIGSFADHDGFDGAMLGEPGEPYHLEFTRLRGHVEGRAPSADNLLVFYLPNADDWRAAIDRMARAGYEPVKSFNPYRDRNGCTFEDPDGYRVVLQNAAWVGLDHCALANSTQQSQVAAERQLGGFSNSPLQVGARHTTDPNLLNVLCGVLSRCRT